jgi:lysyl-tRNA synthetase class 2
MEQDGASPPLAQARDRGSGGAFGKRLMPSTVIRRFHYRPEDRELDVLFTTGRRYVYYDVPQEEADAFRAAFSKGRYFNSRIRDAYDYREAAES